MKLAVLTHGFPSTQNPIAANFLEPFLEEIVRRNHQVWVLTQRMDNQEFLSEPYPVEVFDWGNNRKLIGQLKLWNPSDISALIRFLIMQRKALFDLHHQVSLDHVLAVWMVPNAIAARSLKKHHGVEYSTWSLGSDINRFATNPLARSLLKSLGRDATRLFANSNRLCNHLKDISGRSVEFLPTYRPLEKPASEFIPRLNKEAFHFLCVARLEPVKGPDILIDAFIELISDPPSHKDIHLHLLGDGTMRKMLENRIRNAGQEFRVHFYGMVSPARVAGFLRVVDCLVLPSRNESMPVTFWEAQASGVPVIGTDVGDLRWAIDEFGQGIVIRPEDVAGLTEAMRKAVISGKNILKPRKNPLAPDSKQAALKFIKTLESRGE